MNERTRLPRYAAIMEEVQSFIHEKHLKPGDQIPTEAALMDRFGVSRATVRQAIQELVHEGVVEKRHGSGTFVAAPKLFIEMNGFFSFYEEASRQASCSATEITHFIFEEDPADKVRRRLKLGLNEGAYAVHRVRSLNGEAALLEVTYLPGGLFAGLGIADLGQGSIYRLFKERGIAHVRGRERFRPHLPDAYEREVLGIAADVPVFRFSRLLVDDGGRPVEYTVSYMRADQVELSTSIDKAL